MRVVRVLGRGAAVAFLLCVVSRVAVATPFDLAGKLVAGPPWPASHHADLPEPCAQHVIACNAGRFGELDHTHATLFEAFAARLDEATSSVTDAVDPPADDAVAWALYAGTMTTGAPDARGALTTTAASPTPDTTLFEDVSVLVQQVPEPPLLVSVLLGIAGSTFSFRIRTGRRLRRAP